MSQHEAGLNAWHHEWDPDTESIEAMSDVEVHDVVETTVVDERIDMDRVPAPGGAFSSLDVVSFTAVFQHRAHAMRSVPLPMRGTLLSAIRVALQEIVTPGGLRATVVHGFCSGCHCCAHHDGHARFGCSRTDSRCNCWVSKTSNCAEKAHQKQDVIGEAMRATLQLSLVEVGELSEAKQALENAALAHYPCQHLTDTDRRPPNPRQQLSQEVARTEQAVLFELDELTCLRKARRCAAPGPSGMKSDNIFPSPREGSRFTIARPHRVLFGCG